MSDWETKRFPPRAAKLPPPAHGIKIKKAGTTWWGQRWIAALREVLRGQPGRLERGATYARAGRTHDLRVARGKVTALVTGSRSTPYEVSLELVPISASTWNRAIAEMAKKAQFSAELLAGQMPLEIDELFVSLGVSLFPRERAELTTACSCPDFGDPCKHVAATHYVLGEALDRDPFLLFELRGRTRDEVLAALRGERTAPSAAPKKRARKPEPTRLTEQPEAPRVSLRGMSALDYEKAPAALPALQFSFEEPEEHGAVLRQLGTPRAWSGEQSPAEALAPLVRRAAEQARRLAMAEAAAPCQPAAVPAPRNGSVETPATPRGRKKKAYKARDTRSRRARK